ncbi:MAG TPA: EexN family lipoprotein [Bosea sp. (in: a-proteobacteria)]|jgi:hypothetical protein|uniref:EexN family lipoprotein n=2 Tax=Bosea TaxID=85413 RepID=A0ABW0NZR2_9HYPH|nr:MULTISPECIES: EexN family lipoprotein [Hyphomicrobiales]PZR86495.1 MAG: hypothetical protein DI537_28540 [Stutzerimonas stutzeri]HEV2555141.1 EexN family lipoprotein [Bosea sp. (in: a-proteobacteria)]
MSRPLIAAFLTMALSGCGDEQAEHAKPAPIRDVPFFLANAPDHEAALARCRANPGDLRSDATCRNAEEANRKVMIWGRDAALKRASN